ncbi:PAS domain-containing protein [Roseococcus sp.]|uniref:PAS domain-containing protein n=1 Tax=Roseococcus sp. TaxID=2109646 RepID=UPI003BAC12F7
MTLAFRAFLGLLFALAPAGLVLVQMERQARTERVDRLAEQARLLVEQVAARQSSTVGAARQLLSALGATPRLGDTECRAVLGRILQANPRYLAVELADAQGRRICSTRSGNAGDPGWLEVLRGDAFRLGGYEAGTGPAGASLSLAEPVRDPAGRVVGAVGLTLSLDWLGRDLQAMGMPPQSTATIADRNGIVLASSHEDTAGHTLGALARRLFEATAAGVTLSQDGQRRIAYMPPGEATHGLFLSVGLEEHPDSLLAGRRTELAIVGALLLSFLLALFTFHTSAERPVQALLAAARRWRAQDWHARVGRIGGGHDFSRIAAAFDEMAETVELRQRAEARWEACMEAAPLLVLAADPQGKVQWVNAQWRDMTGRDLDQSLGDGWLDAIDPRDRAAVEAAWRAALAEPKGAPLLQELRLRGGARCLLKAAPAFTQDGEVQAWAIFGLDVRKLRLAEAQADASGARLRAIYAHAPVGLCLLDRELCVLAINDRLARAHGKPAADHIGRPLAEVAPHFAAELHPRLLQLVATGEAVEDVEFCAMLGDEERCWLCSYHPVHDRAGTVVAVSGAVIDITSRRRMETSAWQLSREVDHRAQNALSVVRGLLRLSAADAADDVPALVEELEGRIGAMSRAHDILSRENWMGADLGEILRGELAGHPGRIEISGPSLRLVPEAAQPMALALHELVNNAQRYGALSTRQGRVSLTWTSGPDGAELNWVERGGPPVLAIPERVGFGSMLIDANMRTQLAGDIHRHWDAAGLRCVLSIGAAALATTPSGMVRGPLAGKRVLLVEDDPISALSLASVLREGGCEVLGPARSGAEAIFLAGQAGRVDVVVLAGRLGGRPVRQLAEALRARAGVVLHISPDGLNGRTITPRQLRDALTEALASARDDAAPEGNPPSGPVPS